MSAKKDGKAPLLQGAQKDSKPAQKESKLPRKDSKTPQDNGKPAGKGDPKQEEMRKLSLFGQKVDADEEIYKGDTHLVNFKPGDYTVEVHIIETRQLHPRDRDGMSDPLVVVSVLNDENKQKTEPKEKSLNCIWDTVLIFDLTIKDSLQLEHGTIEVAVMDHNRVLSDVLIGKTTIDLFNVFLQPDHRLTEKWLALMDPTQFSDGPQGFIQLSAAMVVPEKTGHTLCLSGKKDPFSVDLNSLISLQRAPKIDNKFYVLHVEAIKAEDLPAMDFSFGEKDSVDAFLKVEFGGSSRRTPVISNTDPEWNSSLKLPVMWPIFSDLIQISVYDQDLTSSDDIIAAVNPPLSFRELLKNLEASKNRANAFRPLSWYNLYGAPQGEEKDDAVLMNRGVTEGSAYRGRVLLRAFIEGPIDKKDLGGVDLQTGGSSAGDADFPSLEEYTLMFECYEAAHVGSGSSYISVEVSVGKQAEYSRSAEVKKGVASWYSGFKRTLKLPSMNQVPDVFINLCESGKDGRRGKRIGFIRKKASDLMWEDGTGYLYRQERRDLDSVTSEATDSVPPAQWEFMSPDTLSGVLDDKGFPGCLHFGICLKRNLEVGPDLSPGSVYKAPAANKGLPEWRSSLQPDVPSDPAIPRVYYSMTPPKRYVNAVLTATVACARDLPAGDASGTADPYVEIQVGDQVAKSPDQQNTRFPNWHGHKMTLNLSLPDDDQLGSGRLPVWPILRLRVMDKDTFMSSNDILGQTFVPIKRSMKTDTPKQFNLFLNDATKLDSGEVFVGFRLTLSEDITQKSALSSIANFQTIGASARSLLAPADDLSVMDGEQWRVTVQVLGLRDMPISMWKKLNLSPGYVIEFDLGDGKKTTLEWPEKDKGKKAKVKGLDDDKINDSPNIEKNVTLKIVLPKDANLVPAVTCRVFAKQLETLVALGSTSIPLNAALKSAVLSRNASPAIRGRTPGPPGPPGPPMTSGGLQPLAGPAVLPKKERKPSLFFTAKAPPSPQLASSAGPSTPFDPLRGPPDGRPKTPLPGMQLSTPSASPNLKPKAAPDQAVPKVTDKEKAGPKAADKDKAGQKAVDADHAPSATHKAHLTKWDPYNLPFLEGRSLIPHEWEDDLEPPYPSHKLTKGQTRGAMKLMTNDGMTEAGLLKAYAVIEPDSGPVTELPFQPRERVVVRAYVLRGLNIHPKDDGGKCDPYLVFSLGGRVEKRRETKKEGTLQPFFYEKFETQTVFPGPSQLKISVFDFDKALNKDDEVGTTVIDLENRWFSKGWKAVAATGKLPVERRSLWLEKNTSPQGQLECIVEILTISDASKRPSIDIHFPTTKYQLRVVIWRAQKMVSKDSFTNMNDLYIAGIFETGGEKPPQRQETDTHLRAKKGKGSFNWRMIFDIELPCSMPVFKIQAFDKDIIGQDAIGESVLDLSRYFAKAQETRQELMKESKGLEIPKFLVSLYHPNTGDKSQGEIEIQMDLLPFEVAQRRLAGNKREEPNRYPPLPEPEREKFNLLRPDMMLMSLLGPDLCKKILFMGCLAGCCACMLLILPMLGGDILIALATWKSS